MCLCVSFISLPSSTKRVRTSARGCREFWGGRLLFISCAPRRRSLLAVPPRIIPTAGKVRASTMPSKLPPTRKYQHLLAYLTDVSPDVPHEARCVVHLKCQTAGCQTDRLDLGTKQNKLYFKTDENGIQSSGGRGARQKSELRVVQYVPVLQNL